MSDLPTSAKEAKALGAKFYFNGKPCKRGHLSKRYAHGSCVACKEEDRSLNSEKTAAYCREWRKDNPDKCASYHAKKLEQGQYRAYYHANKAKVVEKNRRWRAKNIEHVRAYAVSWRLKNLEHCRARDKNYPRQPPEKAAAYREKNRAILRQRTRDWRKNNPEKARISTINKKAMRKAAPGRFTHDDVQKRLTAQKHRCGWCRIKVTAYHVDHINPISRGGTNLPNNIQILCADCNMRKHNTDPIDFARREGRLI